VAILGDAESRVHPFGAEIVQRMSAGGPFSVVGILATPAAAIAAGTIRTSLKEAFPDACITIASDDDLQSLRRIGDFTDIAGTVVNLTDPLCCSDSVGGAPSDAPNDGALDFVQGYADELSNNVVRNEQLLSILELESKGQGRVVFFATTAKQARLFAGLLPVHGVKARAVTADESPAGRSLAVQRFVARDEKILCVHGFLLVGSTIPDISVCVIAAPTKSRSAMISTIGRLVQARDPNLPPLKLIVAADSQADVGWVGALSTWSTLDI
jgi:superfamily II DNA or RNA helicase